MVKFTLSADTFNLANYSWQDVQAFLYTPVTIFGYKFLVNMATFLWMYNGVRQSVVEPSSAYNFVIVGGGTAGTVLAARLSENPSFRVLLLEAGGTESPLTDVPYLANVWRDSRLDWKIKSEPQDTGCLGFDQSRCIHSAGHGLGGSSLISGMTYLRGNQEDYNRWAEKGALGWSWADVYPYFMKSENNMDILEYDVYSSYHKAGGPMPVEYQKFDPPFTKTFLDAVKVRGHKVGDYNGKDQLRFNRVQSTKEKGRRVSTKRAYLDPLRKRDNLEVITFATVTRILFDHQKKAVGVEYVKNNRVTRVLTTNEVILSAGALRTPQILLLSGVGPAGQLNDTGIEQVAELPGVGKNLQDHVYSFLHFNVNGTDTLTPERVNTPANYAQYQIEGKGPLTSSGEVGHGFLRTKLANDKVKGLPDIQVSYHAMSPMTFQDDAFWSSVLGFQSDIWSKYFKPYYGSETTTTMVKLLHPRSRGTVSLKTDNPLDDPAVRPNYFLHTEDARVMVEGVKAGIGIALATPFARHSPTMNPDHFPGCESFELWSDEYIQCYVKFYTVKSDDYVGTCKMGSADDIMAVVNNKLLVNGGIRGLRVVDASVMPDLPSGGTLAPTIMLAEKAADLIKQDYAVAV
ncbi:Glucose dehydrogenase -like protein [Halotydeus destructor]|nr:Glucose dehydrogenase -like protein [Halotydeus destructor]